MGRRKLKYLGLLSGLCLLGSVSFAQRVREVVVGKDTVEEFNKNPGVIQEPIISDGIKINCVDSVNFVLTILPYKNNRPNGNFFLFYLGGIMVKCKGEYKDGHMNGTWYYWTKDGFLYKTETWKSDTLIATKKFKVSASPARRSVGQE